MWLQCAALVLLQTAPRQHRCKKYGGFEGSEDSSLWRDGIAFQTSGMARPLDMKRLPPTNQSGAILAVDLKTGKNGEPTVQKMKIQSLPASMGFRPHGLHIDNASQRVFAVSHSTLLEEESIFVFDIKPQRSLRVPELIFRYTLVSSNFTWVDSNNLYFLNDVAAVDGQNELYVTQFGPCPFQGQQPNETIMKQKHLWRCTWDASKQVGHRVVADCQHAWPIKSLGLNGINISPDSSRLWVNDLWNARLWVFDRRSDGRLVKSQPDIYLPGFIDNVEHDFASGDLTMGMFENFKAGNFIGGAILLHAQDNKSTPTIVDIQDTGEMYQVSTSLIYEKWTILGSPWDKGLLICREE